MAEKPRVLCLHGGGASAQIFELQMRCFIKSLAPHFRLVFTDGPWLSEMHEDLKPVYGHMNPCFRWAAWLPHHPPLDHVSTLTKVEDTLVKAMDEDEGTGEWVGVIGFSQGAKLAFSMLLENQLRQQKDPKAIGFAGVHWQFAVIMAGRGPPYNLDRTEKSDQQHYSSLIKGCENELYFDAFADRLRTPTLHVHGLEDAGLDKHRALLKYFASPEHAKLIDWEGAHRIPFQKPDVDMVTEAILDIAHGYSKMGITSPS